LEDLGVVGNDNGMDLRDVKWSHLAQDRDQWRALMNTVMKLWVL